MRGPPSEDNRGGVEELLWRESGPAQAAPPHPHYISPNRDEGLNEVIAIQ